MTVRAAAERFGISAATAVRIGQLDRSGRGLMPAKIGGYVKPTLRGAATDAVRQRLQVKSDWTVRALSAELKSAGINVSHDTVWRFLRSEGKTFKKNADGKRAGSSEGGRFRMRWKTHQHRLDPDRLVFIDETWVKTNMTRTCGWCQRGEPISPIGRNIGGSPTALRRSELQCLSTRSREYRHGEIVNDTRDEIASMKLSAPRTRLRLLRESVVRGR
ncbi:hypothetical protein [Pararhizobium arenae]|uniref:hypothetical protein n=1 Tax=Pararhizobium arenae TaxID=1856850 RepID=UPI001FD8E9FB|nr:hypothetical protein [Pararhizobium arenae]